MFDIIVSCSLVDIVGEGLLAVTDAPRVGKIVDTSAWDGVDNVDLT